MLKYKIPQIVTLTLEKPDSLRKKIKTSRFVTNREA